MEIADAIHVLSSQWQSAGLKSGDIVLVHSSISRILRKAKTELNPAVGPEEILSSLLEAVSSEGTLLLPLFNFDFAKGSPFDIRSTPSQMGILTEKARQYPGAVRTGHPIYSFAVIGKEKEKFKHVDNYSGYGPDSPFAKLRELNGKIAVIDLTDQDSMTSYHYVEEANNVDYRYHKRFRGHYTDWNGTQAEKEYGLFVRKIEENVATDVNRMMQRLWDKKVYSGFLPGQEYGMRTINMVDFYAEVDHVIKKGEAINFLYSTSKSTVK